MSHRVVTEVLNNAPEDLSPLERLTLVCLAHAAHPTDRQARAGSSTKVLARQAAVTEDAMRHVLMRLRERGLIVALVDRPNRGRGQNYYLPKLEEHHRKACAPKHANGTPTSTGKRVPINTLEPVDNYGADTQG